jgi:ribonuclease HI
MLRVYTDGACPSNGKANAKASYAYVFPDHLSESYAEPLSEEDRPHTNQMAELVAIYHSFARAKRMGAVSVHLYTDSDYARKCITQWSAGWIRNGWKKADGKPVVHRNILERILTVCKTFDSFTITHVAAHTGGTDEHSKWNHIADRLAAKAIELNGPATTASLETETTPLPTTEPPLAHCPLLLMGPPIPESQLAAYMRDHLTEVLRDHEHFVNSGLVIILKKILASQGLEMEKQIVHKQPVYRLTQKVPVKYNADDE